MAYKQKRRFAPAAFEYPSLPQRRHNKIHDLEPQRMRSWAADTLYQPLVLRLSQQVAGARFLQNL